ncbi:unnamed protein product [Brugia timori]|uniref:Uncharacterized protein n=1 Tax=Brugia timori TaxID=42155 RepID=A0A0R3QLH4_9BILA|nr:unnamed protein product [Brugia timori]
MSHFAAKDLSIMNKKEKTIRNWPIVRFRTDCFLFFLENQIISNKNS